MRSKIRVALTVAVGVVLADILWFVGWLIYDLADLWQLFSPFEFQNSLFLLMGLTVLASVGWARRSVKVTSQNSTSETSSPSVPENRANSPDSVGLTKLEDRVDELAGKVADISALAFFVKRREEADKDARQAN